MVIINGTDKIKIYSGDTQISLLTRIAAKLKTLPEYLYLQTELPEKVDTLDDAYDILIIDLFKKIKTYASTNNFPRLYSNELEGKWLNMNSPYQILDFRKNVIEPYIAYGNPGQDDEEKSSYLLSDSFEINEIIDNIPPLQGITFENTIENIDFTEILNIWNARAEIKQEYDQKIKDNISLSENQIKMYKEIQNAKTVSYTDLEDNSIELTIKIDMNNFSILEIFNMIVLTKRIPYAACRDFFKIYKHTTPSWPIQSVDNAIILKIYNYKYFLEDEKLSKSAEDISDMYSTILIQIEEMGIMNINFRINVKNKNMEREDHIRSIYEIIPNIPRISKDTIKIEENNLSSTFFILDQSVDYYIWADMLMNDPTFSSVMYIDDREKTSKYMGDRGITKNTINMYYQESESVKYSIVITSKIYDGNPTSELTKARFKKKQTKALFDVDVGDSYLRILIKKIPNKDTARTIQNLLSKFIGIYNDRFEKVLEIYKQYIPNFKLLEGLEKKKILKKDTEKSTETGGGGRKYRLADIDPYIFRNNYATRCQKMGQPTIITGDEIQDEIDEGREVMIYPKTEDEGINQHYYVCKNETYKYPGLIINPIEADNYKDEVPLLPCCFKIQHSQTKNKPYYKYLNDIDIFVDKTKQNFQQDKINTDRFAGITKTGIRRLYGRLPEDLNNLLKNISPLNPRESYQRRGVFDTNNSFLECIIEIMSPEILNDNDNYEARKRFLTRLRKNFSDKKSNIALCSQNMYDSDQYSIEQEMKSSTKYFDPRIFTQFLEELYNCDIYTFSRKKQKKEVELIIPSHSQYYYKNKYSGKRPVIIIYEHWGGRTDDSTYPRCEIVFTWSQKIKTEDEELNAIFDRTMGRSLYQLFTNLRHGYILNNPTSDVLFNAKIPKNIKFIYQGCDSYGKTRYIRYRSELNNKDLNIITDPIPPLNIPRKSEWAPVSIDISDAITIATIDFNIPFESIIQTLNSNGFATSIKLKVGNIFIYIPIHFSEPRVDINIEYSELIYPQSSYSELVEFNFHKKITRYLVSYMLWLYSIYIQEFNLEPNLDSIYSFQKNRIKIDTLHEYENIPNNFSLNSSVLDKSGRLLVKDLETKKRLVYTLRIESRNRKFIKNYREKQYIENYYEDLTDFDNFSNQIIFQGKNVVEKWIREKDFDLIMFDKPDPTSAKPYFFRNPNIHDGNVFICYNYPDLDSVEKEFSSKSFYLINYDFDNNKYRIYIIGKNPNDKRVIAYRYMNTIGFTIIKTVN